jgi:Cu+-exporting ATPase
MQPAIPALQHCQIVHRTRHRLRILAPSLRHNRERAYIYEILLRKHKAIKHVRITPGLGSVTVYFDPLALPGAKLPTLMDSVLGNLGSAGKSAQPKVCDVDPNLPDTEINVALEGMTCASCALLIEILLRRDPRVSIASVNFATETAQIRTKAGKDEIYALIRTMGYTPLPMDSLTQRKTQLYRERNRIETAWKHCFWSSVLSLPTILIGMFAPHSRLMGIVQLAISAPVIFWNGRNIFEKAYKLAKRRSANMDSLVALGVGSAYAYSFYSLLFGRREYYFEAAAGIITFVLMGRYLDEKARGQAHEAIRQLIDLQPQTATLLTDDGETIVHIDDVRVGDLMLIRPGERIPTDGEVISGISTVDESMITGESMPIVKELGHRVTGGCINGTGSLQVRATAVGADTVLSGIVHMVDQAQASRLPIQKMVDQVSSVFVPGVVITAGLTFASWLAVGASFGTAFGAAITVLLIACPCALGLATPAAIMVGTGQAARRGIFIRNGESLEMASKLTAIVFDKTGTITEGRPKVTDLLNLTKLDDNELLAIAASAESHSEHFLGKAIVTEARALDLQLSEPLAFQAEPGLGIAANVGDHTVLIGNQRWLRSEKVRFTKKQETQADELAFQGKTPVFMAIDGKMAAIFGIADKPRPEACEAIAQLQKLGVKTLMATGDVAAAAEYIASVVGIDRVVSQAKPEQKLEIIRELQAQGEKVGMIGDGINDAPALAAADVSLAIGGGTDIAMQTADLTLVNGDIAKAAEAMEISSFTIRVIRQNLFWAFGYNVVAIPVAAMGKLNPMIASAAMAMSSVSVVLNSLRLQKPTDG